MRLDLLMTSNSNIELTLFDCKSADDMCNNYNIPQKMNLLFTGLVCVFAETGKR